MTATSLLFLVSSASVVNVASLTNRIEQVDDITYMRDQLSLELNDSEARLKFVGEIKKSLEEKFRRVDNWIHNLKHG
jgi:hypothetical protein